MQLLVPRLLCRQKIPFVHLCTLIRCCLKVGVGAGRGAVLLTRDLWDQLLSYYPCQVAIGLKKEEVNEGNIIHEGKC